jgi:uncharacterized membrane protein
MHEVLKLFHILAVILLGGAILVDTLTGIVLPRLKLAAELRALTRVMRVNQYIGVVAIILIPVFGYALAAEDETSLGTTWLLVSQVLFWAAVVASWTVLVPGSLRIARRAEALPDGPIPDEVMKELRNPIFPALGSLLTLFFVFILYLMVVQPGW